MQVRKNKKIKHLLKFKFFGVLIVSLASASVLLMTFFGYKYMEAASYDYVNFQGKLTDASGFGIANQTKTIRFSIFDHATLNPYVSSCTGNCRWTETQSVTTDARGIFSVQVGSSNPTGFKALFTTYSDLYLGVKVDTDAEMTPRHPIGSVPSAINSQNLLGNTWAVPGAIGSTTPNTGAFTTISASATGSALTLSGAGATLAFTGAGLSQITTATNQHLALMPGGTGNVGIGTTGPASKLEVAGTGHFNTTSLPQLSVGTTATEVDGTKVGIYFYTRTKNNVTGGIQTTYRGGTAAANTDLDLFAGGDVTTPKLTIEGTGNVGIGTTSPASKLSINGDMQLNTQYFSTSVYSYANGALIATDIAATTDNTMIELYIEGNSYSAAGPIQTKIQAYNYNTTGTIINTSGISEGPNFPVDVFHYNGFVYFWLQQPGSFQTMRFRMGTHSGIKKITAITNEAKPVSGVTNSVTITPLKGWYSYNDGSGSGLDADTLDAYESSAFSRKAEIATITGGWTFDTAATTFSTNVNFPGSGIWNTSGNVGIGTTGPSSKLEVNGGLELTNLLDNDATNFFDGGCSATTSITGIDSTGAITCTAITGVPASSIAFSGITSGTNAQAAMLVGTGASLDYTGTGTINASSLLGGTWAVPGAIGSTTPNTGAFTTVSASATGNALTLSGVGANIAFSGAGLAQITTATNQHLALMPGGTGNVGIGTTNPYSKFHTIISTAVSSGALFSTSDWNYGVAGSGLVFKTGAASGDTYSEIDAYKTGAGAWGNLVLNSGGGNVGIGTTSPASRLHLVSTKTTALNSAAAWNTAGIRMEDDTAMALGVGGGIGFTGKYTAAGGLTYFGGIVGTKENATEADVSGVLRFFTTTSGGAYPTEKMRISNAGNVGIGTTSPTVGLELGSTTAGLNQIINATEGSDVFNNATDFVVAGHWTLTAGWESTNDAGTELNHNAAGTTTALYLNDAPVIGNSYKITYTMNASVVGGVTASYGGVTGVAQNPAISTPTTYTMYVKATAVTNLTFTPVTGARFVITSISIIPVVDDTGDSSVYGDLLLAGRLRNPSGTIGLQIAPNGQSTFGGPLAITGALTGATSGAFSTTITHGGTVTGTVATLFVPTLGHAVNAGAAATGLTAALIPMQYSPSIRWLGYGWNATGTPASNYYQQRTWAEPYTKHSGSGIIDGRLKWELGITANSVLEKDYAEIMSLGRTGGADELNVLGQTFDSESLVNPSLTSGTNWSQTGSCALTADTAVYTHNATQGSLYQDNATMTANGGIALKPNRWYRFTYTTSSPTITVRAYLDETYTSAERIYLPGITPAAGVGQQQVTFKTNSNPSGFKIQFTSAVGAITLDTFSLKEVISGNIVANGLFTGGGTSGIKIDNGGNVGIGATSPLANLHINGGLTTSGDSQFNEILFDSASFAQGVGGGVAFGGKYNTGGSQTYFGSIAGIKENATDGNYAGALTFETRVNGSSPTERMRITSGGNVGIGTTNPVTTFQVTNSLSATTIGGDFGQFALHNSNTTNNNYSRFYFATNDTGGSQVYGGQVGVQWINHTAGALDADMVFNTFTSATSWNERLRIDGGTGNVGIGTAAPGARLHVEAARGDLLIKSTTNGNNAAAYFNANSASGALRAGGLYYIPDNTAANSRFAIAGDNTTEHFVVTAGGKVGIGTTGPSSALDVVGSVKNIANTNAAPVLAASLNMGNGGSPGDLDVVGRYAYVASNFAGTYKLRIYDITTNTPVQKGSVDVGWNIQRVKVVGKYAYIADANGTLSIVDISNPSSPAITGSVYIASYPHYDLAVYGRYVYLANQTSGGLIVVDVGNPAAPVVKNTVSTTKLGRSIDVVGRYAYVAQTNNTTSDSYFQVFDLVNPASPSSVGGVALNSRPVTTKISGRYAYVLMDNPTSQIQIVDISNPASPSIVSTISGSFGTSQGTMFDIFGRYLITTTGMYVYDVSNPASPTLVGTGGTGGNAIKLVGTKAYTLSGNVPFYLNVNDISGIETTAIIAHAAELGTLSVRDNTSIYNNLNVGGALSVGYGGLSSNGLIYSSGLGLNGNIVFNSGANRSLYVDTQTTANTAGNNLTVNAATGNGTGTGGSLELWAGTGGATGTGGTVYVTGGPGGATSGAGGAVQIQGGTAAGAFAGGTAYLYGGMASATAGSNGGAVAITGSAGSSAGTGGAGGIISIFAGNAGGSGDNNGGYISLRAGSATGAGTVGKVLVQNAADSITAFQVQNTAGTAIALNVDTTNSRVGIGTGFAEDKLHILGSNTDTFTTFGGNLGIKMGNASNTVGNYTSILNYNSANTVNSGIYFKNVDHAYAGRIDFVTRSLVGEYGVRMTVDETGKVGIGTTTPGASLDVAGRTIKLGPFASEYRYKTPGSTDLAWKKVADVVLGTGQYKAAAFKVEVLYANSNFGHSADTTSLTYYVSAYRSGAVQDDNDTGTVSGPVNDYVRLVKTATGVYELQVRQTANNKNIDFTIRAISASASGSTITYADTPADGSTTGTIYTATSDSNNYFTNGYFSGALGVGTMVSGGGTTLGVAGTYGATGTRYGLNLSHILDSTETLSAASTSYGLFSGVDSQNPNLGGYNQNIYGVFGRARSTTDAGANINIASGVYGLVDVTGGATITSGYALRANVNRTSGTITNGYGLYIDNIVATNGWGIYQFSADDSNYFAGNVGIGTSTPTAGYSLDVYGPILARDAIDITSFSNDDGVAFDDGSGSKIFSLYRRTGFSNEVRMQAYGGFTFYTNGSTGTEKMRIESGGNVGIGLTPSYRLDVSDAQSASYVARIKNTNTANTADGLLIDLGIAVASRATTNRYIDFAGAGVVGGSIQGGGSGGNIQYQTSGADYAEYFKADPGDLPAYGELVMIDTSQDKSVLRSSGNTQMPLVGVVSSNAGFVGNGPICQVNDDNCDANYAKYNSLVALSGQVATKANISNGPISIGDPITSSVVSGEGAKATTAGYIVGYALEPLVDNRGYIRVLVRPHQYSPETKEINGQSLKISGSGFVQDSLSVSGALEVSGLATLNKLVVTGIAGYIGIGTMSPIARLHIEGASDIVQLLVRANASQTADLMQVKDSTNSLVVRIDPAGNLTVKGLTLEGHIVTGGEIPTITAEVGAGEEGTVSISGNDTSGTITVTTGTTTVAGILAKIKFASVYGSVPRIILTPTSENTTSLKYYPTATTDDFTLSVVNTPAENTTYTFDYWIAQ